MNEMVRILKPNGFIFISLPVDSSFYSEEEVQKFKIIGLKTVEERFVKLDSKRKVYICSLMKMRRNL